MLSQQEKIKIRDLIEKGQQIEAIKYIRDNHQLSLKDAKDWFDNMDKEVSTNRYNQEPRSQTITIMAREKARSLVLRGKRLDAVKYINNEFGLSLKHAKEFVDSLESPKDQEFPFAVGGRALPFNITAAIGLLFILLAAYIWWTDYKVTHDGITITGKVIELKYDNEGGAKPVVGFKWAGESKILSGSVYSNPPSFEVGESVDVIVSESNPNSVVLDFFVERFLLATIFGILGIIPFLIGVIGMRR